MKTDSKNTRARGKITNVLHSNFEKQLAFELQNIGWSVVRISKGLGVPPSTVRRWLDPSYAEKQRQLSREAKQRRATVCPHCGGRVHYQSQSGLCCHCAPQANRTWTRETLIDAVQRYAAAHGAPPRSKDWPRMDPVNRYPGYSTCYGVSSPFATWGDMIEAAGFPRPHRGRRRKDEQTQL